MCGMATIPQQSTHYTRLSDFGAFQAHASTLCTREMAVLCAPEKLSPQRRRARSAMVTKLVRATKKKWINFAIRAGLTGALFFFLFRSFSWSLMFMALTHIHYGMVLVAGVVGAGGVVLSAYQWRSLLRTERIHFDLADLINLYVVGIAFSHFLPTGIGGDAVKALHVGRESRNSAGSLSAVMMCRITGFVGMLLVSSPVLVVWHDRFRPNFVMGFIFLCVLIGVLTCGVVLASLVLPNMMKASWKQNRIISLAINAGFAISASTCHVRSVGAAIAYSIVFWGVAILNCYSYAIALGIEIPLYFFCVAVPLIALISALPISINGFGVRENAFVYVFSTMHVPATTALLLAFLLDAQALFFGAIGSCIYLKMSGKQTTSPSDVEH